ncbi:MAG TPA: isoaspartyl peptidase/L-asparaginase [Bacteroidales bacterium]|nr:isoaspartyl peptidase/L-asparaginase [Bacteroidales bacterium]
MRRMKMDMMKNRLLSIIFSLIFILPGTYLLSQNVTNSNNESSIQHPASSSQTWVLVIHGGAGGTAGQKMAEEVQLQYTTKMTEVLKAGAAVLSRGGTSMDAVETCIRMMEDSPLFNAGKGAVFTEEGKNEMDASIMDGRTLKAGAVAGVTTIKNPISAARAVMEKSKHVMLIDGGAEKFAKDQGLEIVPASYFYTKKRWDEFQKAHQQELNHKPDSAKGHGTVGAVALDSHGDLTAGTSTGGMTNKMKGRIGDSPVIGAGTYANNNTCAVSCTGHGEYFIRNVVAYDVSARMEYKGQSLQEATRDVVNVKLKSQGAEGGLIAVDRKGNIAMPFNTALMFRGTIQPDGKIKVMIY